MWHGWFLWIFLKNGGGRWRLHQQRCCRVHVVCGIRAFPNMRPPCTIDGFCTVQDARRQPFQLPAQVKTGYTASCLLWPYFQEISQMIASSIKAEVVKANARAANDTGSQKCKLHC